MCPYERGFIRTQSGAATGVRLDRLSPSTPQALSVRGGASLEEKNNMHAPAAALSTNDNRPRSTRERIGTPRRPMGETERETATNEDAGRTLQVRRPARPSQRIAAGAHVPDGCGCHPFQSSEASPTPGGGARMRVLRCSLRL